MEMALIYCLMLLLSRAAGLRLSPDDNFDTCTITEEVVYHMAEDAFKTGNVLFGDRSALKTTDCTTTSLIVGSALQSNYTEGDGDQARFDGITSTVQLTANDVLVADNGNHCFRTVDRITNTTATYIGSCGDRGDRDGTEALFNYPWAIIEDLKNPGHFFITEYVGRALRYMSVGGKQKNVSTLYRGSLYHFYMAQQKTTGDVYITYHHGVKVYDYLRKTMYNLVGSSYSRGFVDGVLSVIRFHYPGGIVFLTDGHILLADEGNYRLRLLDLTTYTSSSICSGIRGHEDWNLTSCQLWSPKSLLRKHDTVYVGEEQRIRKIQATGPPETTTATNRLERTSTSLDETTRHQSTTEELSTMIDIKLTKGTHFTTTAGPPTETTETTHKLKYTHTALGVTTSHKSTAEELSKTYDIKSTNDVRTTGKTTETPIPSDNNVVVIAAANAGTIIVVALIILVAYIVRLRTQSNSANQRTDNLNIGMRTISETVGAQQNVSWQEDNPAYASLNQNTINDPVYSTAHPDAANTQPRNVGKNLSTSQQNPDEDSYLYPSTNLADSQLYSEPSY